MPQVGNPGCRRCEGFRVIIIGSSCAGLVHAMNISRMSLSLDLEKGGVWPTTKGGGESVDLVWKWQMVGSPWLVVSVSGCTTRWVGRTGEVMSSII